MSKDQSYNGQTVYDHYILLSNPAYSHTFENRSSDPPKPPPLPAGFAAAADPVPNPVVAGAGVAAGSALPHPPKSSSAAIVVSAGRVPPLAAGAETGAPHPSSARPLDLVAAAGDLAGSIEGGAAATGSALVHTSGEPHGSEAPSGEKLDVAGFAGLETAEERLNGEAMVGEVVD